MKRKRLFLSLVVVFTLACGSFADESGNATAESQPVVEAPTSNTGGGAESAGIDSLMAGYTDAPGGAVMVIQDGEIVFQQGYGLADMENGLPVSTDSIFHLGSVGKQFTAMGIMMLAEQGLLDYDTSIGSYLPELERMGDGVTIRQLLHHTSGIMGYDDSDEIYDALVASSDAPTNNDLLNVLAKQSDMLAEPGEEFNYSNTGYDILGALIERLSGQTYPVFMQERIFQPLGMVHTFAVPDAQRMNGEDVAKSYYFENGQPVAYEPDILDGLNGSGSIYSTLGDLYLYDQALYTDTLVNQETLTEAYVSGVLNNGQKTDYGFALDLGEYAGETYVGHSGAWLGFESYYLRFPERNLSVVVLLNFDYSESGAEGIAFSVVDLYLK